MRFFRFLLFMFFSSLFIVPIHAQDKVPIVIQSFEGGEMIYRADTGDMYVFSNKNNRWWLIKSREYGQLPLNQNFDVPENRIRPIMGIGRVWANYPDIQKDLGWAVNSEISMTLEFAETSDYLFLIYPNGITKQLSANGAWQLVPNLPQPYTLDISLFEVSHSSITKGQLLTIRWQAKGSDYVQILIEDTAAPDKPVEVLWDGTPEDGGILTWEVPFSIEGNLEVTMWLVDREYFPTTTNYQYYKWLTSQTHSVDVYYDESINTETYAAFQRYQHGFMLWREDTEDVLLFFNDGGWQIISQSIYGGNSENQWPTPEGCIKSINAFGRVWGSYGDIRERIGCAIAGELSLNLSISPDLNKSFKYQLSNGREFWLTNTTWWD